MATNTAGTTARELATQQVVYIRKATTFADGNSATVTIGTVPANALMLPQITGVFTLVAYNSGTNNNFTYGTTASAAIYLSAQAFPAAGSFQLITGSTNTALRPTTDIVLTLTNALTGTQATTGSAIAFVNYMPNI